MALGGGEERKMMPGDMPCNAECANNMCHWNIGNCCLDNEPCPAQVGGDGKEED